MMNTNPRMARIQNFETKSLKRPALKPRRLLRTAVATADFGCRLEEQKEEATEVGEKGLFELSLGFYRASGLHTSFGVLGSAGGTLGFTRTRAPKGPTQLRSNICNCLDSQAEELLLGAQVAARAVQHRHPKALTRRKSKPRQHQNRLSACTRGFVVLWDKALCQGRLEKPDWSQSVYAL